MSYLLLSKYPPLCIRTIYGCIISSQNYKLQITNYIKVVGGFFEGGRGKIDDRLIE